MKNPIERYDCETIRKKVYEEATRFRYVSVDEATRTDKIKNTMNHEDYISIPRIDIELAVKTLCLIKQNTSCAVVYPFYETSYSVYPLLLSARSMLINSGQFSYLIIGGRSEWLFILKNVYGHGDVANHPLLREYALKNIHDLKKNGDSRYTRSRARSYVRWIFSEYYNYDLWYDLDQIALIIVDLTSQSTRNIEDVDVEEILKYSEKASVPVVFYLNNPLDIIARHLSEVGMKFVTPSLGWNGENGDSQPSRKYSCNTSDEELKTFLNRYNLKSGKIAEASETMNVEVTSIEEESYIDAFYRQYLDSQRKIKSSEVGNNSRHLFILARTLFNRVMEFTGAVNKQSAGRFDWKNHPVGDARERLYDISWKLDISDTTRNAIDLLLDKTDAVMREFEMKPTPKGEYLVKVLKNYFEEGKNPIVIGKTEVLLDFLNNSGVEHHLSEDLIISSEELAEAKKADLLIILNPLFGKEKAKLLTACTDKVIILNYQKQSVIARKTVEEIKQLVDKWYQDKDGDECGDTFPYAFRREIKITYSKTGESGKKVIGENLTEVQVPFYSDEDLFSEFEDIIDEEDNDDVKDIDQDLFYYVVFSGEDQGYSHLKWVVPIENRDVTISENKEIVLVKDNRTYTTTPPHLKVGDTILISKDLNPRSMSDLVWEIMEKKMRIDRRSHPSNEWRYGLGTYVKNNQGITYPQIFEILQNHGKLGIKTSAAIYLWLESDDIIGPKDDDTLKAIASLLGKQDRLQEWRNGIRTVRSIHNRMMRQIWQVAKYSANKLKNEHYEDYIVDPRLGIRISELLEIVRFATVTGFPRKVE